MIDNQEMVDFNSKLELWFKKYLKEAKKIYWKYDDSSDKYWLVVQYVNFSYHLTTYKNGCTIISLKEPTIENFFKEYGGHYLLHPLITGRFVCKIPKDELELELELSAI